jgi:hypothetical protein
MFAELAKLATIGPRRAASGPTRPVHSNDNRPDPRLGAALWTRRPILLCRWQPVPGSHRLECRWHIELRRTEPQPVSEKKHQAGSPTGA